MLILSWNTVRHVLFYPQFENININFYIMGVLYCLNYYCFLFFCKFNSECFDPFAIFIIIIKTWCTFITFPWVINLLKFCTILQICAKAVIFDWNWIFIGGYWFFIWFKNFLNRYIIMIGNEQKQFKGSLVNTGHWFFYQVCVCLTPLDMVDE